ncbi:MAG: S1C family serine protease [Eubacterium sp.]|nr:S1C family serine protease [Eubacterium sp.]
MSVEKKQTDEEKFIREKIKDKPLDKKSILKKCITICVLGLIFGASASVAYSGVNKLIGSAQNSGKENFVITESGDDAEEEAEEEETPEVIVEQQTLEVEDYQKLQNKIYAIGKKANKSIVEVVGIKSDTDIFDADYESENVSSGLIIGQSGGKVLILTTYKVIEDASKIQVTFVDDYISEGELVNYDRVTGLSVVAVAYSDLPSDTTESIQTATLEVSKQVKQGDVVLAVGSPLGSVYSVLFGSVTSVTDEVSLDDSNYTVYTTNMMGNSSSSGVLVNLDGEVIGITLIQTGNFGDDGMITAIPAAELKTIIEKLSNGEDAVYLGVKISTVTNEIAEEYDIPAGVYVKSVEKDSPAFEAGLQTGDVIIALNDTEIATTDDFMEYLSGKSPEQNIAITIMRQGKNAYKEISCSAQLIKLE